MRNEKDLSLISIRSKRHYLGVLVRVEKNISLFLKYKLMNKKMDTTDNCTKCWVKIDQFSLCNDCYLQLNKNIKEFWVRDYQDYVNIDTPSDIRERLYNIWDIWSNEIQCKHCLDKIRSKNWHNFVMCKCWKVGVDWGSYYSRMIWNSEDYIENIIPFNDVQKR